MRERPEYNQQENHEVEHEGIKAHLGKIFDLWFDPKEFETRELYEKFGITLKDVLQTVKSDAVQKIYSSVYGEVKGRKDQLGSIAFRSKVFETMHLACFAFFSYLIAEILLLQMQSH
ncbi:MAG: hypothetical protein KGJ93_03645 [Patescibacteria group bacterium]|nr:hypothetical protein [Patescibacteria group bacterium]